MTEPQFTTLFQFTCSRCQQPNEYRQTHAPWVRPHLVSTKCTSCRTMNWLGGITGTLLPPDVSGSMDDVVLTVPEGGTGWGPKKPFD